MHLQLHCKVGICRNLYPFYARLIIKMFCCTRCTKFYMKQHKSYKKKLTQRPFLHIGNNEVGLWSLIYAPFKKKSDLSFICVMVPHHGIAPLGSQRHSRPDQCMGGGYVVAQLLPGKLSWIQITTKGNTKIFGDEDQKIPGGCVAMI